MLCRITRRSLHTVINEQGPASWPSYDKPPILEASFTIQIEPLEAKRYALLGRVGERLGSRFTKTQLLEEFNSKFLDVSGAVSGMVYSTSDEKENVQARSDGFSFSRQAPYESWDVFLPQVQKTWEAYKAVVSPLVTKAVLLKYVNSITFPLGIPLHDLFNTYPAMPDQSQLFDAISLFYRVTYAKVPDIHHSVFMTNLPIGDKKALAEKKGRMLLDNTLQFNARDESEIWSRMPLLRKLKNEIFESQLKPVLKEQFK
jgi:uncharacterized protein (TIGR04255 family)